MAEKQGLDECAVRALYDPAKWSLLKRVQVPFYSLEDVFKSEHPKSLPSMFPTAAIVRFFEEQYNPVDVAWFLLNPHVTSAEELKLEEKRISSEMLLVLKSKVR